MIIPETPPGLIAAELHALDFGNLEAVHHDAADEGDVHALGSRFELGKCAHIVGIICGTHHAAVHAGALEADEGAELGRGPLRGRGGAVGADGVERLFLKGDKL